MASDSAKKVVITSGSTYGRYFPCDKCPMHHEPKKCPKKSNEQFKLDFTKLTRGLQKRFVEIADVYEKYKLQQTCKLLNTFVESQNVKTVGHLIVQANVHYPEESNFWNAGCIHPDYESHLRFLENLLINEKFMGIRLRNNFISTISNQNVFFYLTKLHLEYSDLTSNELRSVCDYGGLEILFLENIKVTPSPKLYEIAMWTANAKRIHINITNLKCENNWPKFFHKFSSKRQLEYFLLKKASMKLNPNDLDLFIRSRMVISATRKDKPIIPAFRISFDESQFKNSNKRTIEKKFDQLFKGVFKRVIKAHFENFSSLDRFYLDLRRSDKSDKNYFYVNCRAIEEYNDRTDSIIRMAGLQV